MPEADTSQPRFLHPIGGTTIEPDNSLPKVALNCSELPYDGPQDASEATSKKGLRFWIIFVALSVSVFLSAVEQAGRRF